MDVHLITEAGVEQRAPEDLPALLERREGLVWADIPRVDPGAAQVLAEVFRFHRDGHPGLREPQPRAQGARVPRPRVHRPALARAGQGRPRPPPGARPVRRARLPGDGARAARPGGHPGARVPGDERGAQAGQGWALPPGLGVRAVARHHLGHDPPPGGVRGHPRPRGRAAGAAGHGRRARGPGAVPGGAVPGPSRADRDPDDGRPQPRDLRSHGHPVRFVPADAQAAGRRRHRPARSGSRAWPRGRRSSSRR